MPIARIENYHGEPAIMIDGKPYPPMTITLPFKSRAYLKKLGEAGYRIFYVIAATTWNNPGHKPPDIPYEQGNHIYEANGLEQAVNDMRMLLEEVPDAYIILRLNVSPPADWVNSHPEEMLTYSDGSHRATIVTTVERGRVLEGMPSLCSELWKKTAETEVNKYLDALGKTPFYDRVIGFFLCAGGTSEWYYPCPMENEDGTYADFSEPFRKEYEAYLRKKYGTVEKLRKAWKREDASFEKPLIPTLEERSYIIEADEKILHSLRNWEFMGRSIGLKVDLNGQEKSNVGVFLNSNSYAHVADFYDAWHQATANSILFFAELLKKRNKDLLVGAFYGSFGCTEFYNTSTTTGVLSLMDSGLIDFLAAPGTYNDRQPGGILCQRQMQDSFRIRNQIYICEDDLVSHQSELWVRNNASAIYTYKDTETILKRSFAQTICEDVSAWWFDQTGTWYDNEDILRLFRRQQEIAQYAYSLDRTKHNEIALIFDTDSVHRVSTATSQLVADFYRTSDLARIGAPVDYYFHDDMARQDMPDYKFYIMVNVYDLSDAEREAIFKKARKNHAVVLWLYAPGFIDPDAERVMDVANIEKTVGMKLTFSDKTFFPHFRVVPSSHPALRLASASRRYGVIERNLRSANWITSSVLNPPYVNPWFSIQEDSGVTILGRYCSGDAPAMAMTDKNGFTSIYCAAPVLQNDMLMSLAAFAGCHIYAKQGDVLYANESFVAIHAKDDGTRRVTFKKPCSPFEVYEKKYYGHNVEYIDVDMQLGETKMWCVNGECQ